MSVKTRYLTLVAAAAMLLAGQAMAIEGLRYQAEPFENLVVSGQPDEEQLRAIAEEGFTTVINLRRAGEFDDFDEAALVGELGMTYVHIPVRNVASISAGDVQRLNEALKGSAGPVLLHCTIGWRAGSMLAIERYLYHGASEEEALRVAAEAHMGHASGDVEEWIRDNGR